MNIYIYNLQYCSQLVQICTLSFLNDRKECSRLTTENRGKNKITKLKIHKNYQNAFF